MIDGTPSDLQGGVRKAFSVLSGWRGAPLMFLTLSDLVELTGYKRPADQVRALRAMGVRHFVRMDGRPVVAVEALCGKSERDKDAAPDLEALNG